jgi:hypothetical protein
MAGANRVTRSVSPKTIFPSARDVVNSSLSYNQGDLLVFDDTNNLIKKPAAESEGSTFLGLAPHTLVLGKLVRPYSTDVDASQAASEIPGPEYGVIAKLVLKTGAALNPGDSVYLDPANGTYHVQEAGTKAIGIYAGPAISSAVAGQLIEVLLGCRHPGDVLKF